MANLLNFITYIFSYFMIALIAGSLVLAGYIAGVIHTHLKFKNFASSLEKDLLDTFKKS